MTNSLDFIGDIHGHYDELCALLQKLGYVESAGAYRYPGNERTVVFLGDYVDRGPKVRETLNLVRALARFVVAKEPRVQHAFFLAKEW